jgi:hypothetical protein
MAPPRGKLGTRTRETYTKKRRDESADRQQAERRKVLGTKREQIRRSNSIYYGIMGHGAQFNAIQDLVTSNFALPPNVKVVTLTIPGAALMGMPKSFHVFHAILKHLSIECLEDLFRPDSYGHELRQYMSRVLVESNEFGNVGINLYEGLCPDMLLNATMNHYPDMTFQQYMKHGTNVKTRWVNREPQLAPYRVSPDDFSFLFLKRKGDDRPLTVGELPPLADQSDFDALLATGYEPLTAQKMLYSHEAMDVDPDLMRRYFDAAYTLSTFVRKECTDVSNMYHIIVFACRSPMFFDAGLREVLFNGNFMNIDANAFVQRNASNNVRRATVPRSPQMQNAAFEKCDPTRIWI